MQILQCFILVATFISIALPPFCRKFIECSAAKGQRRKHTIHAQKFWHEFAKGDGHAMAEAKLGRRKKKKSRKEEKEQGHAVCCERGLWRHPGGSTSRMFT